MSCFMNVIPYLVERDGVLDGLIVVRELPLRRESVEGLPELDAGGRLVEADVAVERPQGVLLVDLVLLGLLALAVLVLELRDLE